MKHYPVTARFWRGVFVQRVPGVSRACDWLKAPTPSAKFFSMFPDCEDCKEYKTRIAYLDRTGKAAWMQNNLPNPWD